jgi:hypothetical protein
MAPRSHRRRSSRRSPGLVGVVRGRPVERQLVEPDRIERGEVAGHLENVVLDERIEAGAGAEEGVGEVAAGGGDAGHWQKLLV